MSHHLCHIKFKHRGSRAPHACRWRLTKASEKLQMHCSALLKRDHNRLFSVCLMGCEENMCIGFCPRVVCLQTDSSWARHKWEKVRRKAGEPVLIQQSEIAVLQMSL